MGATKRMLHESQGKSPRGPQSNADYQEAKREQRPAKKLKVQPPYVTHSTDKDGREVDYVRHEPCKGKGCAQCDGLGFTKQYKLL